MSDGSVSSDDEAPVATFHPARAPSKQSKPSEPARTSTPSGHTDRNTSRGDHTVRAGDTLSGIAARYGTTWQRLYEANRSVIGGDPDVIVPGQRLDV